MTREGGRHAPKDRASGSPPLRRPARSRRAAAVLAVLLALPVTAIPCSAGSPEPADAPAASGKKTPAGIALPIPARTFAMGVGPHPRVEPTQGPENLEEAFDLASGVGEYISQNGPWCGWSGKGLSHGLALIEMLAGKRGLAVLPQLSFWTKRGNTLIPIFPRGSKPKTVKGGSPSCQDPTFRSGFLEEAERIARRYQPLYLVLGIEVNSYAELRPEDFPAFVSLYKEAYRAVKKASPSTRVFPTFHYGLLLDPLVRTERDPAWDLVRMFEPELDAVGLTTYPSALFDDPEKIPEDYYRQVRAQFPGKKIAFGEIGWAADPSKPGALARQATFLRVFLERTRGLDLELIVWTLLHDLEGAATKTLQNPDNVYAGLRERDGVPKPAWAVWERIHALPRRPAP